MGELLKKVGDISTGNAKFEIELNGPAKKNGPQMIHVQNPKFRFECEKEEFLKICSTILFAEKNLNSYKSWDENNT